MRPIAVDLFSGAGGLSLGFEQAGFDVKASVEIDPVHCAVHAFNFPDCAVIPRSVIGLSAREVRLLSGIGDARVDCVFGGPPCQGFSMIGQRAMDDPRNQLVLEFVRLVSELDAQSFVFENVKGLTVGKHRAFLDELVSAFDQAGYDVRLPWSVLDAANFGVPQHRHRLILMGVKKGSTLPSYPNASHVPADAKKEECVLPVGPTSRQALGDLPDAELFDVLNDRDWVESGELGEPSTYAAELRCLDDSHWHFGYRRRWDSRLLTSSARTDHNEVSRKRFADAEPGKPEPVSRLFKLDANGLSNTLRAGTDASRGAFTSPRPIHYEHARCITVREMARLQGFPDWFRFHATKWHGARQVGNSVPPPLARAVAREIMKALGRTPTKPACPPLPLGNEGLLTMTVTQAADHFDVPPPSGKRERRGKSDQLPAADDVQGVKAASEAVTV